MGCCSKYLDLKWTLSPLVQSHRHLELTSSPIIVRQPSSCFSMSLGAEASTQLHSHIGRDATHRLAHPDSNATQAIYLMLFMCILDMQPNIRSVELPVK